MSDEIRNGDDELLDDANVPVEDQPVDQPLDEAVDAAEPEYTDPGERDDPPAEEPPVVEPLAEEPPTASPTAAAGSGGMGRRDVLKALATVPVLGALGYTALHRKGLAKEERARLLAELGI